MFPVEILLDADVRCVQLVIFQKKEWMRLGCDPSELILYLARSCEGEWLEDDSKVRAFLRWKTSHEYVEMRPTWTLDELLGSSFSPAKNKIQILVRLPRRLLQALGIPLTDADDSESTQGATGGTPCAPSGPDPDPASAARPVPDIYVQRGSMELTNAKMTLLQADRVSWTFEASSRCS